ncbi:MAG: hypothetical protein H7330_08470 [Hymenobacteraceae bacterium]|nr:hypothetical protein [Hymenobacteraceae bacterium]
MRYLISFALLFALLLALRPAVAQPDAVPALPLNLTPKPAAKPAPDSGAVLIPNGWYLPRYDSTPGVADTTGALLALFRRKRVNGWLFGAPWITGVLLALPIAERDQFGNTVSRSEAIAPGLGFPLMVGAIAGLIVHTSGYRKSRLQLLDRAYATGTLLPARYRHKLKEDDFAEAAILRWMVRLQQERDRRRPLLAPPPAPPQAR